MGALIVLASSSNLSSVAILRLRICGKTLVDFPDSPDHRFWFFLKNAGLYHFVVEDLPHLLISIALLNAPALEGFAACTEGGGESKIIDVPGVNQQFTLPVNDNDIARWSLITSAVSIAFGIVSKAMQQLGIMAATPSQLTVNVGGDGVQNVQTPSLGPDTLRDLRPSVAAAVSKLVKNGFSVTGSGAPIPQGRNNGNLSTEHLFEGEIGGSE